MQKARHIITKQGMSQFALRAQYAVRGALPIRAGQIQKEMNAGKKFPFSKLYYTNIGNPQPLGLKPQTFNREVQSACLNRALLSSGAISKSAASRAEQYLSRIPNQAIGGYSQSGGFDFVREKVVEFIYKRDQIDPKKQNIHVDDIFLANGASQAIHEVLVGLLEPGRDAVMIPIPQYPLYAAELALQNAHVVKYYLQQEKNWSLNMEEIERAYDAAPVKPKIMVLINPGNPTGQVLSRQNLQQIIKFCYEKRIAIMCDQVYQKNIYTDQPFYSAYRVAIEMGDPYSSGVEIFSFHSTSKGLIGECGLRGGYAHFHNLDKKVWEQLYKIRSIGLCPNTMGQICTGLLVDPPQKGREEDAVVALHEKEEKETFDGLKRRADLISTELNKMKNITCQKMQGSMYAFPQLHLQSDKLKAHLDKLSKQAGKPVIADFFYCMQLLEQTGIVTVPGSGFDQVPGTFHLRTTNLVNNYEEQKEVLQKFGEFNEKFHQEWS